MFFRASFSWFMVALEACSFLAAGTGPVREQFQPGGQAGEEISEGEKLISVSAALDMIAGLFLKPRLSPGGCPAEPADNHQQI